MARNVPSCNQVCFCFFVERTERFLTYMSLYTKCCSDVIGRLVLYSHYWFNFWFIMKILKILSFVIWLLSNCTVETILEEWFDYIWWLPVNFLSENVLSLAFTSELTAFISNVVCSLVLFFGRWLLLLLQGNFWHPWEKVLLNFSTCLTFYLEWVLSLYESLF